MKVAITSCNRKRNTFTHEISAFRAIKVIFSPIQRSIHLRVDNIHGTIIPISHSCDLVTTTGFHWRYYITGIMSPYYCNPFITHWKDVVRENRVTERVAAPPLALPPPVGRDPPHDYYAKCLLVITGEFFAHLLFIYALYIHGIVRDAATTSQLITHCKVLSSVGRYVLVLIVS